MWRLGGPGGNVTFAPGSIPFSKQHDVRFIETRSYGHILSILNNAWEGALQPSDSSSSGQIISVNNETMTATTLRVLRSPTKDLSGSQGNLQPLLNDNILVAWGATSRFTEYAPDGNVLYHATITNISAAPSDTDLFSFTYRVFKLPWTGTPRYAPKLIAYSTTCEPSEDAPLRVWVSWNGATEVQSWRFAVADNLNGPWAPAGTWPKAGFETLIDLTNGTYAKGKIAMVSLCHWFGGW